jgi:hypothetical protein
MGELKTKVNKASATAFIKAVPDEARRRESQSLLDLFKKVTCLQPKMWGSNIIGFGSYHYKSERSRQEGDWMLTGFSPRKDSLSIYIIPGFSDYGELLKKLGTFKTSVGCLYIKKLADIDLKVLEQLVRRSVADMKRQYGLK